LSYDLSDSEQRRAAFLDLQRAGEEGVSPLADYIWDRLHDPKAAYVALMAQRAGLNGSSLETLKSILRSFLARLDQRASELGNLPLRDAYSDFDSWNEAALTHFRAIDEAVEEAVRHYADYVVGG
jgi:hypothetical protein